MPGQGVIFFLDERTGTALREQLERRPDDLLPSLIGWIFVNPLAADSLNRGTVFGYQVHRQITEPLSQYCAVATANDRDDGVFIGGEFAQQLNHFLAGRGLSRMPCKGNKRSVIVDK